MKIERKRRLVKRVYGAVVGVLALSISGLAGAAAQELPHLRVPAGDRQLELSVEAKPGEIALALCTGGKCDPEHAISIGLPNEVRGHESEATLNVVEIAKGRRVAHIRIPSAETGVAWEAIVAAPIGSGEPRVIFHELTGLLQGEAGERSGPMVVVRGQSVLVGKQRQDVQICGRDTILAPELLSARDFSLHAAKVQRLSADERKKAIALRAEPTAALPEWSPLHALLASSAVGSPQALTDGDPNTYWGENRGGDGRGEFVVLRAPKELPLRAFDWMIRSATGTDKSTSLSGHEASPKQFWLATTEQLFSVTMPEDGWQKPGAAYRVQLPTPIQSDCVAVVLETSFSARKDAAVVIAELQAESEFKAENVSEAVNALNDPGERADAAAAALRNGGSVAFDAVSKGFVALSEHGRELALDVIDRAPCAAVAPVYVAALMGSYSGQRTHAESRLERCKDEIGKSIVAQLQAADVAVDAKEALAKELPDVAPELAANELPALLVQTNGALRAAYRDVLTAIAEVPTAEGSLRAALADRTLTPTVRLDLVRALADFSRRYDPELSRAFTDLVRTEPKFEQRYLLLEPASKLAATDQSAHEFLKSAFAETSAELRAEAAHRADPKIFEPQLIVATRDGAVRVREAAVETLARSNGSVSGPLLERLENDNWPVVRAAAAHALGGLPPSSDIDDRLESALDDESRHVRLPVVVALGERHVQRYAAEVRAVLANDDEDPYVRAAAATALGAMCDIGSLDLLTRHAVALAAPRAPDYELAIARSAVLALASLGPSDLAKRLAPLSQPSAPATARRIAHEVLGSTPRCPIKVSTQHSGESN